MRWALPGSLVVHVSVLLAGLVVLPSAARYKVKEQPSIPVDIVSLSELSQRQATKKKVVKKRALEKPAPEKPKKKVKVPKKPTPKPAREIKKVVKKPAVEPKPEPKPEPKKADTPPDPDPLKQLIKRTEKLLPDPVAKPDPVVKKAVAKPKPEKKPKKKPKRKKIVKKKKKKPAFNPDQLALLLNKIKDERGAPPDPSETNGTPVRSDVKSPTGSDKRLSADAIDWLRQRVGLCWNIPAGVQNAQNLVVKVRFQLDRQGNLQGTPTVSNFSSDPLFQAAARSAIRALIRCQPYDKLPKERYAAWKDLLFNFDPSQMLAIN